VGRTADLILELMKVKCKIKEEYYNRDQAELSDQFRSSNRDDCIKIYVIDYLNYF